MRWYRKLGSIGGRAATGALTSSAAAALHASIVDSAASGVAAPQRLTRPGAAATRRDPAHGPRDPEPRLDRSDVPSLSPYHGPESVRRRRWAAVWLLLALASLAVDVPAAEWFKADRTPHEFRLVLYRAEVFGHAFGVVAIAITMAVLDPIRRPRTGRLVIASLGAGLMADLLKLLIQRTRPRFHDLSLGVWSSFVGVLGFDRSGQWTSVLEETHHSFPSAHTASAVGLATGLSILYPRGRAWFGFLAALCAMNRVDGCAHFVSDMCVGVAVGILVADWSLGDHRSTLWIDRITWVRSRRGGPQ